MKIRSTPIRTFGKGWLFKIKHSPDGRLLASASEDMTVRLWDVATGKNVQILEGHRDFMTALSFTADGRHVFSASYDGTQLISATDDNTIRIWGTATGQTVRTMQDGTLLKMLAAHTNIIESVNFSRDDQYLVAGSDDGTCSLWSLK